MLLIVSMTHKEIFVQTKSYLEDNSVVSDASNASSGNKREGYRSKSRKEKKKKKGKWVNNKKIKWKNEMKTSTFPTHPLPPKSDPQIKGVPAAVAAELQAYVDQA